MRWGVVILLIGLAGCAGQARAPHATPQPAPQVQLASHYEPVASAALVFDPPVTADEPRPNLSRAGREPGAFVGYEELTTTFHYIRVDDRQTDDFRQRYERRSISEQVGVRYR